MALIPGCRCFVVDMSSLRGLAAVARERLPANVDWFIFGGGAFGILGVCLPLVLFPETGKQILSALFHAVTDRLGPVYLLVGGGVLLLLLALALSPWGRVSLGPVGRPQFGTFSWASMLFCGGIGTSVLYWGTVEWAYYLGAPPFSVAPNTPEAMRWASSYPIFHWGLIGWALYCLPGVAIAYAYHVRGMPALRLSAACEAVLGRETAGWTGRLVDLLFMVGLLGAVSTGVGLAIPMIGAGLSELLGFSRNFTLDVTVICLITGIFAASVYAGMESGIKRLSNLNVGLAFLLLLLVLGFGPTRHVLEESLATLQHLAENFVTMVVWLDLAGESRFDEEWTVFYWAWWLALGPFMGMFITKISRGRTIRQVIFGTLGFGSLGCALFFLVLGHTAQYHELEGQTQVLALVQADDAPAAVVGMMHGLPLGKVLVLPLFLLICVIFAATSYDSAAYTLAASASRALPADAHPARWHRVFWAFAIGGLPISLVYVGGLNALQSAVVVVSVPLLLVFGLLIASLFTGLLQDSRRNGAATVARRQAAGSPR